MLIPVRRTAHCKVVLLNINNTLFHTECAVAFLQLIDDSNMLRTNALTLSAFDTI